MRAAHRAHLQGSRSRRARSRCLRGMRRRRSWSRSSSDDLVIDARMRRLSGRIGPVGLRQRPSVALADRLRRIFSAHGPSGPCDRARARCGWRARAASGSQECHPDTRMVPFDPAVRMDVQAARRARIAAQLGDATLVLYGGELRTRSNDTEYRFRPDSDFHYLTGLREPGAVMVLRGHAEPRCVLFVRPRDADAEVWAGRRIGPEGALARYGADAAHPISELAEQLPKLLDG